MHCKWLARDTLNKHTFHRGTLIAKQMEISSNALAFSIVLNKLVIRKTNTINKHNRHTLCVCVYNSDDSSLWYLSFKNVFTEAIYKVFKAFLEFFFPT